MASRQYAAGTTVTATRTEAEIKDLLSKRGVEKIGTFNEARAYTLLFELGGVAYKLILPLPDPSLPAFREYKRGSVTFQRTESAAKEEVDKEINRRWRAFGAVIKAKIVAVEEGISTMEREFIGDAMTSTGRTVAEEFGPQIKALGGSGRLPTLELPYKAGGR